MPQERPKKWQKDQKKKKKMLLFNSHSNPPRSALSPVLYQGLENLNNSPKVIKLAKGGASMQPKFTLTPGAVLSTTTLTKEGETREFPSWRIGNKSN